MSMVGELVKTLRDRSFRFAHDIYFTPTTKDLLSQAADTIEELSAKVTRQNMESSSQYCNGGWIPCEEMLPQTTVSGHFSEDMLVAIQWGDGDITNDIGYYDSKSTNTFGKWNIDCLDYHVIAWQPLPPKYEPNED